MNWLKEFTAALVEEDERRLIVLIDSLPEFTNAAEAESALELIKSATEIFEKKREELKVQMAEIEKQKKFLSSDSVKTTSILDIHS